MFGNQCLGELKYEATATAIAMAGAFLAFLVDYVSHRLAHWRSSQSVVAGAETRDSNPRRPEKINAAKSSYSLAGASHHHHHDNDRVASPTGDATSVLILEAGIIFHSLLLGITLVVAGDSVFITLFIVIIFHQMFEGLALGARIAVIDTSISSKLKRAKFLILPLAFAVVTPLGMGIGIGVLNIFNGNDPKTIVALGTLDSLSAGILLWVGFVDMWAGDWIFGE
jgi:zinc transporter 1/2/3